MESKLTLIKKGSNPGTNKKRKNLYRCLCGNVKWIIQSNVVTGTTKSCGCITKMRGNHTIHGKTRTKVYRAWQGLRRRCTDRGDKRYNDYGGRGITVCSEWLTSFEVFYRDMGEPPTKNHSIDRIDNSKGYTRNNCKWATTQEQLYNKRTTVRIGGKTIPEIMECNDISRSTVERRLKNNIYIRD